MTRASMLELPFAIAHRGGHGPHAENTAAAFQYALDLGYERLETDVHVNNDGEVLALHGLNAEGEEVDEGGDYIHVDGKVLSIAGLNRASREALKKDGIDIPTLNELLDLSDNAYWNIDAKAPAVVDPLLELIASRKIFGKVCLGSFSEDSTAKLRANIPDGTQTAMTLTELFELYGASSSVDAMITVPEHIRAQVPLVYSGIPVPTPDFIAAASRHQIPVEVWTINDEPEMRSLIDVGVAGIFTDELEALKNVLISTNKWTEQT